MTRRKKGGNKDNNKPEEASAKAMDTSKQKKDSHVLVGDIQEKNKPPIGLKAPSNSPQHVFEKKLKKDDDGKSEDAVCATMQPVGKVAANVTKKMTINDKADSTSAKQAAEDSKKKRNRRRGESTLDNLGSEPIASTKHDVQKTSASKKSSDKDAVRKLGCVNKALEHVDLITRRISELESNSDLSRTFCKLPMVDKKRCSTSEKGKMGKIYCTKEEKKRFFSKDDRYIIPEMGFADSDINNMLRPIIFMTDQTTQTDSIQDPLSSFEPTDGKNSIVPKSDSDVDMMNEQKKSTIQSTIEEIKSENVPEHTEKTDSFSDASCHVETPKSIDGKPEPPSFSKSDDNCKITLKADSVVNKPNESTLLLPAEEKQTENISKDTPTFQDKNDSFSNLSSFVETFQSTTSTRNSKSDESEPQSISKLTDGKDTTELTDNRASTVLTDAKDSNELIDKENTEVTGKKSTEVTDNDSTEVSAKDSTEVSAKDSTEVSDDRDSTEVSDDRDSTEVSDDRDSTEVSNDKDSTELTDSSHIKLTDDKDITELIDDKDSTELTNDNNIIILTDDKHTKDLIGDKHSPEITGDKDSTGSIINKQTELNIRLVGEKSKPQRVSELVTTFQNMIDSFSNVSSHDLTRQNFTSTRTSIRRDAEPEHSSSKSTENKKSTVLKSDSDGLVLIEPVASASYIPHEGTKPENDSEHAAAFQNQIDSSFNTSSPGGSLENLTNEFLEDLETKIKELEEKLTQYLSLVNNLN